MQVTNLGPREESRLRHRSLGELAKQLGVLGEYFISSLLEVVRHSRRCPDCWRLIPIQMLLEISQNLLLLVLRQGFKLLNDFSRAHDVKLSGEHGSSKTPRLVLPPLELLLAAGWIVVPFQVLAESVPVLRPGARGGRC